ncbi:MAG: hypothetical protein KBG38_07135, partial [Candidatus Cloacimonas sp.]|nr:hypothetical protein [Candidatus Cloacimonas sp.]
KTPLGSITLCVPYLHPLLFIFFSSLNVYLIIYIYVNYEFPLFYICPCCQSFCIDQLLASPIISCNYQRKLDNQSEYPVRKEHSIESIYRKGLIGGLPNLGTTLLEDENETKGK